MEEAEKAFAKDALRCVCPNCGDTLHYDIESRKMKCDSCAGLFEAGDLEDKSQTEAESMEVIRYTCPSCGAAIHAGETAATSYCSYCGADVVLTQQLARIERPARIVPFSVTREKCEEIYRAHLNMARFAPSYLQEQETIDHFRPVYVPFWEYYYEAEGESEGRGTQVYDTEDEHVEDSYSFVLSSKVSVSGLLYDASSLFEDETANSLEFDNEEAVPFHPAYLSGMYAEAADTESLVYLDGVKHAALKLFGEAAAEKTEMGGGYNLPEKEKIGRRIVLMPVWMLAKREEGRVLYTAVNGYSGKIVCDPPVSRSKFAAIAAAATAGLAVILMTIAYATVLRPNLLLVFSGIMSVIGMNRIVPAADEILLRREMDVDPTRRMKRTNKTDKTLTLSELDPNAPIRRSSTWELSGFTVATLIFATAAVIIGVSVLGFSRFIGAVISDRSIVPPFIMGICAYKMCRQKYMCRQAEPDEGREKAGTADNRLLILMRILLWTSVAGLLLPLPYPAYRHYILSMAILILMCVNMLRLNGLNKEFVTRPIPNFFTMLVLILGLSLCMVNAGSCEAASAGVITAAGLKPEYVIMIDDSEDLLSDKEEQDLLDFMTPLSEYGNVLFWSNSEGFGDEEMRARDYLNEAVGDDLDTSSTLFMINMGSRQLWIQSRGALLKYISISNAYNITGNVADYATQKDYFDCAAGAFAQMYKLVEGRHVPSPMRYICAFLMSLFGGLMGAYWYVHSGEKTRVADPSNRDKTAHSNIEIEIVEKRLDSSKRTKIEKSSGGIGGSSCGGSGCGGGGSSCGGGGGSGF